MTKIRSITLSLAVVALPLFAQQTPLSDAAGRTIPPDETSLQEVARPAANDVERPAVAPEAVKPLFTSFIDLGLQGRTADTNSSKFEEYRDVAEGLSGPHLRLYFDTDARRLLMTAERLVESDRRIDLRYEAPLYDLDIYYDEVPHRLGNGARSILVRAARDAWGLNDITQRALQSALEARVASGQPINFAFLSGLVDPLLSAPYVYDLGFDRRRGGIALDLFPETDLDSRITYFQENRNGTRPVGSSFGFNNVVETGEPIDYTTREAGVRLEMPLAQGLVRGGIVVNQFKNRIASYTFDNPFRGFDSTDPNAFQAPAAASINGPTFGRMALAPDSDHFVASIGGVYRLPMQSRISADLSWGQLSSNDRLIPFSTNTAILMTNGQRAADPASLPDSHFNGRINTLSGTVTFNSRPIRNLGLTARLRHYDLSNRSERIRFDTGYVRFDASLNPTRRITVPYDWSNTRLELLGTYDLGTAVTIEGGFRHERMDRTFRETEETSENVFRIGADYRPFTWATFRTSFEFGERDYDHYDPEHAEHASFVDPRAPTNLLELRRYDQARRDTSRVVTMFQLTPFTPLAVSGHFTRYFDDYDQDTGYGLLRWKNNSWGAEADYTPSDRWNVFAFYTRDEWSSFQRGRQSAGVLNPDPRDDWTARLADKANTWGLGGNYSFIPDRLGLRVTSSLQKVAGSNDLDTPPGGALVPLAVDIPSIDDTSILSIAAELRYAATAAWQLALGGWYEDYDIFDMVSSGTRPYMPGAFFLVPNDGPYRGSALYLRAMYSF